MEHILATTEIKVRKNLVKLAQKQRVKGENGEWKEFLNFYDKQAGSSLSDPSRRSKDALVAFLKTLKQENLQHLARVLKPNPYLNEAPDETAEQRLVLLTVSHDEYPLGYFFPSDDAEDWLVTGVGKNKLEALKATKLEMVAIDCEMVLCEDGSEAVVKVAAVDRHLKVILDEFVRPDKPVVDYKTNVTGITAEDLKNATTLSVVDIQKKLQMFLCEDIILIGQSLNHDMKVLKIDHARVIDTSLVFKYKYPGASRPRSRRPSLNNLCKYVLGYAVQEDGVPHNCVHDAAAAMELVFAIVEKGVETSIPATKEMLEKEKSRLMLHGIPQNVPSKEVIEVISRDVKPKVLQFKRQGDCHYKVIVFFNSPAEANQAFENIVGVLGKDILGLPQKQVFLNPSSPSGPTVYVRKMLKDDAVEDVSATKRSFPEDTKMSSKKQKREYDFEFVYEIWKRRDHS